MATGFKMDKGWARLDSALDPSKFKGTLRRHLRLAARRNGKLGEARMRQAIADGGFDENAELTKAIKGSAKPLVDKSKSLFQAITSVVQSDTVTFVGVQQSDRFYNVAVALHEGEVIAVTPKMRSMFLALARKSAGREVELTGRAADLWARKSGGWLPLKKDTKAIVIPGRPFTKPVFTDAVFIKQVKKNWSDAIKAALKEQTA